MTRRPTVPTVTAAADAVRNVSVPRWCNTWDPDDPPCPAVTCPAAPTCGCSGVRPLWQPQGDDE